MRVLAFGVAFWASCGSIAAQLPPAEVAVSEGRYRKEYILSPGDQVEIVVRRVPEVSRTVVIRPDGYITLPLADSVRAAGLSVDELKVRLSSLLSKRLVEPEVTAIAVQMRQPMVYVGGEVGNPSAVPLRNAVTAVQAIAATGGLRRTAANDKIWLIRLGEDGHVTASRVPIEGKGQQAVYAALAGTPLLADDVLFIGETKRSQFGRFIEDFINRPLQGFNAVATSYLSFRLVEIYSRVYQ